MAYIDTLHNIGNVVAGEPIRPTEGTFVQDFASLIGLYGYTEEVSFKKGVYSSRSMVNEDGGATSSYPLVVAKHTIFKSPSGKYFGIASVASWAQVASKAPSENFDSWLLEQYESNKEHSLLYFYMLESIEGISTKYVVDWSATTLLNMALDIEIEETVTKRIAPPPNSPPGTKPTYKNTIAQATIKRMQSPIIEIGLRDKTIIDLSPTKYDYPLEHTNWWEDSEISVRGYIDDDVLFFILNADPVPNFERNSVPTVPLYFGKLDTEEFDPYDGSTALFSGTYLNYGANDPDDKKYVGKTYMPLLKNYVNFPGNGIDNVIVSRSKLGARYQAYFLSWDAPSNLMPPKRENEGKKYSRSWAQNFQTNMYKTKFNPSAYDDRVHSSKVYLIHHEEGVRGALRKCIAFPPINFNAQKIKVRDKNCNNNQPEYDTYRYHLIEGFSPLTKRPGTHYRPAGIGIYYQRENRQGDKI